MTKEELLKIVNETFGDVLDEDDIVLEMNTTAKDVEGWDSLTHVQLVVAIEKRLGVRFTSKEIQSWNNVEELLDSILNKKG